MTVKKCIRQFEDWLTPEDEIWVWAIAVRRSLSDLWERYALRLQPRVRVLYLASGTALPASPYALLSGRGEEVPAPQYRAENDAEALRRVLRLPEMQNGQPFSTDTITLRYAPPPRQRNLAWAEHAKFNFVYLNNSPVFHRVDCPLWAGTENREALVGCITYKTAAKTRRPCRFCKPEPIPEPVPAPGDLRQINREWALSTNFNYIYLRNSKVFHRTDCPLWTAAKNRSDIIGCVSYETASKTRQPCSRCKPAPLFTQEIPSDAQGQNGNEPKRPTKKQADRHVYAHLISGATVDIKKSALVGWCHNKTHIGGIDKNLYLSHDCRGKSCSFFEPNPGSRYLRELENKKKQKQQINAERKDTKRRQAREVDRLAALKELWQKYANELNYKILLVRISQEQDNVYRIFYVSGCNHADENQYTGLIKRVRAVNPELKISLRHIRDVDGHYVTTKEYLRRTG